MIEALYVHIPFCIKKCSYCDFLSFSNCEEELMRQYVAALIKEAEIKQVENDYKLQSIFFGGGTPTCLSSGLLVHLVESMQEIFVLDKNIEISMEANPGTVNAQKLKKLFEAGVNRLSFGVQSFVPQELKVLGRIHTPEEARQGLVLARAAGFTNINIDLMYGLPNQNIDNWKYTLQKTVELEPEHISTYQLKIEEDTPLGEKLFRKEIQEFDDEKALEMYQFARKFLEQYGYTHYEISNFAKAGMQCLHNKKYWLTRSYLGLGAGAHSFLPPKRLANTNNLKEYLESLAAETISPYLMEENLDKRTAMSETVFMGLRLRAGLNLSEFKARYAEDFLQVFADAITECLELELVEIKDDRIRLTDKGLYLGNLVFEKFL